MEIRKGTMLQQIGKQLRKLKIENNRTSKEIASLLNITTQAYGNIERGESDICITRLILLAEFYKTSFLDLIPEEFRNFKNKANNEHYNKSESLFSVRTR